MMSKWCQNDAKMDAKIFDFLFLFERFVFAKTSFILSGKTIVFELRGVTNLMKIRCWIDPKTELKKKCEKYNKMMPKGTLSAKSALTSMVTNYQHHSSPGRTISSSYHPPLRGSARRSNLPQPSLKSASPSNQILWPSSPALAPDNTSSTTLTVCLTSPYRSTLVAIHSSGVTNSLFLARFSMMSEVTPLQCTIGLPKPPHCIMPRKRRSPPGGTPAKRGSPTSASHVPRLPYMARNLGALTTQERKQLTSFELGLMRRSVGFKPVATQPWAQQLHDSTFTLRTIMAAADITAAHIRQLHAYHRWMGHVARLPPRHIAVQALFYRNMQWQITVRSHKPAYRYTHGRSGYHRQCDRLLNNYHGETWWEKAQDRHAWRKRADDFVQFVLNPPSRSALQVSAHVGTAVIPELVSNTNATLPNHLHEGPPEPSHTNTIPCTGPSSSSADTNTNNIPGLLPYTIQLDAPLIHNTLQAANRFIRSFLQHAPRSSAHTCDQVWSSRHLTTDHQPCQTCRTNSGRWQSTSHEERECLWKLPFVGGRASAWAMNMASKWYLSATANPSTLDLQESFASGQMTYSQRQAIYATMSKPYILYYPCGHDTGRGPFFNTSLGAIILWRTMSPTFSLTCRVLILSWSLPKGLPDFSLRHGCSLILPTPKAPLAWWSDLTPPFASTNTLLPRRGVQSSPWNMVTLVHWWPLLGVFYPNPFTTPFVRRRMHYSTLQRGFVDFSKAYMPPSCSLCIVLFLGKQKRSATVSYIGGECHCSLILPKSYYQIIEVVAWVGLFPFWPLLFVMFSVACSTALAPTPL